jgi:hypothetical protein
MTCSKFTTAFVAAAFVLASLHAEQAKPSQLKQNRPQQYIQKPKEGKTLTKSLPVPVPAKTGKDTQAKQKPEKKVLYCEGADGDEKLASARQNHKIALQMLQKAIEQGHVIQDKNGLYVKKCDKDCPCLPIVPSAVPTK